MPYPYSSQHTDRENGTPTLNNLPADINNLGAALNMLHTLIGDSGVLGPFSDDPDSETWSDFKDLFNWIADHIRSMSSDIKTLQGLDTLQHGSGAPTETTGDKGDFYINTTNLTIYGPKVDPNPPSNPTGWGLPTSIIGPIGPKGADSTVPGPRGANGTNGTDGVVAHIKRADGSDATAPTLKFGSGFTVTVAGGVATVGGGGGSASGNGAGDPGTISAEDVPHGVHADGPAGAVVVSWNKLPVLSVSSFPAKSTLLGYRVYRNGLMIGQVVGVENNVFTDTSAAAGLIYEYAVSTYSADGESASGGPYLFTYKPVDAPSAVGNGALPSATHTTGRYYIGIPGTARGSDTFNNTPMASPFIIPKAGRYDRIAFYVASTGSNLAVKVGIYADNGGVPGARLYDLGTFASGTTAGVREMTIDVTLPAGVVWIAVAAPTSGSPWVTLSTMLENGFVGSSTYTSSMSLYGGIAHNAGVSALPATWTPASTGPLTNAGPWAILRKA